jgi:hypothetical protein
VKQATVEWRRRRAMWIVGCTLVFCGLVLAFLMLSIALRFPSADSLILGGWVFIGLIALIEILVPARVIEWRSSMIQGGPREMQELAMAFETTLKITDPNDSRSRRNLRLVGVGILIGGSILMGGLWWFLHLTGLT